MAHARCPICKEQTLTFDFTDDPGTFDTPPYSCAALDGQDCECQLTEAQIEQAMDEYLRYDAPFKGEYDPDGDDWWV